MADERCRCRRLGRADPPVQAGSEQVQPPDCQHAEHSWPAPEDLLYLDQLGNPTHGVLVVATMNITFAPQVRAAMVSAFGAAEGYQILGGKSITDISPAEVRVLGSV